MTADRSTPGDENTTRALRMLYAAPSDAGYWFALETRILAHVARGGDSLSWWCAARDMTRPGLMAAAALVFAASLALAHARTDESRRTYASVIAPSAVSIEPSAGAAAVGDNADVALHYITSR
ncbi:MAG: hypothetical protein H0W68_08010 [Gemmatimonadaceae bacterium]|nr:hypothetical protein [Gemmatimonadaceae bacterium]